MSREASRLRTPLGTQIIDSEGFVVETRQTTEPLSALHANQASGQSWPRLLPETERRVAETALQSAFSGLAAEFTGTLTEGDTVLPYHVNLFPLEWEGDKVRRVCAVFVRTGEEGGAHSASAPLRELVHTVANLTAVANSAANILRRGIDETRAQALAESLQSASKRGSEAVIELREILGLSPSPSE